MLLLSLSLPCWGAQTLRLVTSLDPLEAAQYIEQFEKDSGITVEWIRLSAGEVVARLKAEGDKQSQSVWFGAPVPEFVAAKKAGLLTPYRSKNRDELPTRSLDPNDFFSPVYFGPIAFVTNQNYLKAKNLHAPTSWAELLSDEWKGRITVAYPYTSGTGYTIFAGLISLWGEDKALDYWKELDVSIHHYTKSGSAPIIEVGLGEAAVGIVFAQDAIRKGIARGYPLTLTYPSEGTAYEVGAVALLKNGADQESGKIFIDWITSLQGQNLFHKFGRTPVHQKALLPQELKSSGTIKVIDMDLVKLGLERAHHVNRWREVLKQ